MYDSQIPLELKRHRVKIEYCVPCDYSEHALEVAADLMTSYQHVIDQLVFEMGSRGVFEVEVDGQTIFSEKALDRHPYPGEVLKLFQDFVGHEVPTYR